MLWNESLTSILFKNWHWVFYNKSKILLWHLTLKLSLPSLSQILTPLPTVSLHAHCFALCLPRCHSRVAYRITALPILAETRFELTPTRYIGGMVVMVSEGIELEIFVRDKLLGSLMIMTMGQLYWDRGGGGGGEESRWIVCGFSCTLCWSRD